MAMLEVTCMWNLDNKKHTNTQQLNHVTDFNCSTVRIPFCKLKEQEEAHGDGRLTIIRADKNTAFSPYEATPWTKIEAWCQDPQYGKSYKCYLFIEQHFSMCHMVSFIYT